MVSGLDLLHLAQTAAEAAAAQIRQAERPAGPGGWTVKGHHDFVTGIDRDAEALIAEMLTAGAPGSRVLGEELTPDGALDARGIVWVVDPLDGTTNFLHGYPWFAVSIAAAVGGVLEAGAIVDVPRQITYAARRGGGAWQGRDRLAVSTLSDPQFALIGTGFPFKDLSGMDAYLGQFRRIAGATAGVRRAGAAALDLADVAAGRLDGFWEQQLAPWDVAAGILLIREAGGRATDLTGAEAGVAHGPVVAGNPAMHGWLLECIGGGTS